MVSKDPATNKYLTERGDGHLTSDHHVIGDIFLYVARRELRPIAAVGGRKEHLHIENMMNGKERREHFFIRQ